MKGKVKWYNVRKGYGFITGEDGNDYFVHYTGIAGKGFKKAKNGQEVSFEVKEEEKGPAAVNVTPI